MGRLTSPNRFFKPSKSRFAFLLIGLTAFAIAEFGRSYAKPYLSRYGVDDFGLRHSLGSLGGVMVIIFFGCALVNPTPKQSYRLAAFFTVGFILYEFLQPILRKGVFDWNDVVATGIGYVISVIILFAVWPFVSKK